MNKKSPESNYHRGIFYDLTYQNLNVTLTHFKFFLDIVNVGFKLLVGLN